MGKWLVWGHQKTDSSDEGFAQAEGGGRQRKGGCMDGWGRGPQAVRRQIMHCKGHGRRIKAPCQRE